MTDPDSTTPEPAPQTAKPETPAANPVAIDDVLAHYVAGRERLRAHAALNKEALFDVLAAAGVDAVHIDFDGFGDSGQLEDVLAKTGGAVIALPDARLDYRVAPWTSGGETCIRSMSIAEALEQLAYDILEMLHGGWENNDGAYGQFVFDVAARTVTLDFNERYTDEINHKHEL